MGWVPLGWSGLGFIIQNHTDQLTRGRKWTLEGQEISWVMRNLTLPKDMHTNKRDCVPNYPLWHNKVKTMKFLSGFAWLPKVSSFEFTEFWPFEFLNFPTSFISNKMTTVWHAGLDALWFYGKLKVRKGRHSTKGRMCFCHLIFFTEIEKLLPLRCW